MSISLTHRGLPDGVTPFKLCDLVAEIASGTCKKERLSATAVRLLQYFIRACRQSDFEPGKICGTWEYPSSWPRRLSWQASPGKCGDSTSVTIVCCP